MSIWCRFHEYWLKEYLRYGPEIVCVVRYEVLVKTQKDGSCREFTTVLRHLLGINRVASVVENVEKEEDEEVEEAMERQRMAHDLFARFSKRLYKQLVTPVMDARRTKRTNESKENKTRSCSSERSTSSSDGIQVVSASSTTRTAVNGHTSSPTMPVEGSKDVSTTSTVGAYKPRRGGVGKSLRHYGLTIRQRLLRDVPSLRPLLHLFGYTSMFDWTRPHFTAAEMNPLNLDDLRPSDVQNALALCRKEHAKRRDGEHNGTTPHTLGDAEEERAVPTRRSDVVFHINDPAHLFRRRTLEDRQGRGMQWATDIQIRGIRFAGDTHLTAVRKTTGASTESSSQ